MVPQSIFLIVFSEERSLAPRKTLGNIGGKIAPRQSVTSAVFVMVVPQRMPREFVLFDSYGGVAKERPSTIYFGRIERLKMTPTDLRKLKMTSLNLARLVFTLAQYNSGFEANAIEIESPSNPRQDSY